MKRVLPSTYIDSQRTIAALHANPVFFNLANKLVVFRNSGADFYSEWELTYQNMNKFIGVLANQNTTIEIVGANGKCAYSNKQPIEVVAKLPNYNTKPVVSSAEDSLIGDVTIAKYGKYPREIANIVMAGYGVQSETIAMKNKDNKTEFVDIQTVTKSFPASYKGLESDGIADIIRNKKNGTQLVGHQTEINKSMCNVYYQYSGCTSFKDNFDLYTVVASQAVPINEFGIPFIATV